jgi:hypothetical protein
VVSVFGPTYPVWAGPYRRDGAMLRTDVARSPCYLRRLSQCPHGHTCMQEVAARAVIDPVEGILAKPPSRAPGQARCRPARGK